MTTAGPTPLDVLRAVAAHGLPGAPPLPPLPREPARWRELVALAERQRVLGLLVAAADDGGLAPDDPRRADLLDLHRHWCAHDLRLERMLVQVADRLDADHIDFVVLKGPALAHGRYPDPSLRLFADLDLLVRSGQVTAAATAIGDVLDATPELPELRVGFDDRFGKEVMLRTAATTSAPGGFEIDLHRTLIAGALGLTIPLGSLFSTTATLALGGHELPVLDRVPTMLAACYQASISDSPPRLASARDLAQIVFDDPPPVDDLRAAARRWRATAVVTDALTRTWRTLGLPPEPFVERWLALARPTRLERLLLRAHLAPGYVYWR
ncbi:MAG: nucleotidyltransferase family protein, partial [Acidimicrobiales bacterium]